MKSLRCSRRQPARDFPPAGVQAIFIDLYGKLPGLLFLQAEGPLTVLKQERDGRILFAVREFALTRGALLRHKSSTWSGNKKLSFSKYHPPMKPF
jgi:hypothetical protein